MAGPQGGGRTAIIAKLKGQNAITSHHYQVLSHFPSSCSFLIPLGVMKENITVDGVPVEIEIMDSEEYNRARMLVHCDVILLVIPITYHHFKYGMSLLYMWSEDVACSPFSHSGKWNRL